FGEDRETLFELAAAFAAITSTVGCHTTSVATYTLANDAPKMPEDQRKRYVRPGVDYIWHEDVLYDVKENTALYRRRTNQPIELLNEPDWQVVGIGLEIAGPAAFPRFAPEDGLHVFRSTTGTAKCLVVTSEFNITAFAPPHGITRRAAV